MSAQFTCNPFSPHAHRLNRQQYLDQRWNSATNHANPVSKTLALIGYGVERSTLYNPVGCALMDGMRAVLTKPQRENNGEVTALQPRPLGIGMAAIGVAAGATAGVLLRDDIRQAATDGADWVVDTVPDVIDQHVISVWDTVALEVSEGVKQGVEVVADSLTEHFGEATVNLATGIAGVSLTPLMLAKLVISNLVIEMTCVDWTVS